MRILYANRLGLTIPLVLSLCIYPLMSLKNLLLSQMINISGGMGKHIFNSSWLLSILFLWDSDFMSVWFLDGKSGGKVSKAGTSVKVCGP